MVKGFFDQLGCQETRIYDIPMTEWGQPGNPVVYANCDEGADRTLLIDDNLHALQSAREYGIASLLAIYQPDSKAPRREIDEFEAIHSFDEIMPVVEVSSERG